MNFSLTNMSVAPGRPKPLTAPPWGQRGGCFILVEKGRGSERSERGGMFHLIFEIVYEPDDRFEHDRRLVAVRRMTAIGEPQIIEALGVGRVALDHIDLSLCAVLVVFPKDREDRGADAGKITLDRPGPEVRMQPNVSPTPEDGIA